MDIYERSLIRHRETQSKIGVPSRMQLESQDDLSITYTLAWRVRVRRLPKILEQPGSDLEGSDCCRGLRRLFRPRSWRYWSNGRAASDGRQGSPVC